MTTVVISQPMLFPWPGFFEQLALANVYIHLTDTQFSKGSFTNRIQLKFADGKKWMTVPLSGKGSFQQICNLTANGETWKATHRDQLRHSLRDAPFLNDVLEIVAEVYAHEDLCSLLMASVNIPAAYMGIGKQRTELVSADLGIGGESWQRVLDMVVHASGTRYLTGHGASHYLNHQAFEEHGIAVEYMRYSLTPWPQSHGSFTPYISILDLIAHTGPQARSYLNPATHSWREFIADRKVTG